MFRATLLVCLCALTVHAVPVDNGVEGEPEIGCGPDRIVINFNTQNTFEGHVYVKGLYGEPGCRDDNQGRPIAAITLPFDTCDIRRTRSLNPKGVFVSTTVIVSFHPLFLTKVDRAYTIQCFYMEADKTVDTGLEVSMLTTDFKTQQVLMPVCRYELLDGVATGTPIDFAIVGQQIYHKWTCDSEAVDTFCMIVHSCFVDDTNGDRVHLIDENGCALDRYLLNNPEYLGDLMAGVEAHVFKYADRADLYFQCQVTVLVKEPGESCPRPGCPTPPGRGAGSANPPEGPAPALVEHPFPLVPGSPYLPLRAKRQVATDVAGTVDVIADLNTLDLQTSSSPSLPRNIAEMIHPIRTRQQEQVCVSSTTLSVLLCAGLLLILATIAVSTYLALRRTPKQP